MIDITQNTSHTIAKKGENITISTNCYSDSEYYQLEVLKDITGHIVNEAIRKLKDLTFSNDVNIIAFLIVKGFVKEPIKYNATLSINYGDWYASTAKEEAKDKYSEPNELKRAVSKVKVYF